MRRLVTIHSSVLSLVDSLTMNLVILERVNKISPLRFASVEMKKKGKNNK